MNLRTRIDAARIAWRSFEQPIYNQQKKTRAAKDAHDDHALGRICQAPHPNFLVAHPRETFNLEWQRITSLKRARRREVIGAFFRPGSL